MRTIKHNCKNEMKKRQSITYHRVYFYSSHNSNLYIEVYKITYFNELSDKAHNIMIIIWQKLKTNKMFAQLKFKNQ